MMRSTNGHNTVLLKLQHNTLRVFFISALNHHAACPWTNTEINNVPVGNKQSRKNLNNVFKCFWCALDKRESRLLHCSWLSSIVFFFVNLKNTAAQKLIGHRSTFVNEGKKQVGLVC